MNRIIIEVLGGVADVRASTGEPIQVYLVDWDDVKEGDLRSLEPREPSQFHCEPKQFEEHLAEIKEEAKKYES